jgi:hypothetical protein
MQTSRAPWIEELRSSGDALRAAVGRVGLGHLGRLSYVEKCPVGQIGRIFPGS